MNDIVSTCSETQAKTRLLHYNKHATLDNLKTCSFPITENSFTGVYDQVLKDATVKLKKKSKAFNEILSKKET